MFSRFRSAWALVIILLLVLVGVSLAERPKPGPSIDAVLRQDRQMPYDREGASPRP